MIIKKQVAESKTPEELNKHLSNSMHKQGIVSKKTKNNGKCYNCGSKVHGFVEFGFGDETHASGSAATVTAAAAITTGKSIEVTAAAAATAEADFNLAETTTVD